MFLRFTPQEKRLFLFVIASFILGSIIRYGYHIRAQQAEITLDSLDQVFLARAESLRGLADTVKVPGDSMSRAMPAKLNINKADSLAILKLPGIGPVLAGRILAARRNRPFRTLDDLLAVNGIGPRVLSRLEEKIVIQ